jgi:hypothetical protein
MSMISIDLGLSVAKLQSETVLSEACPTLQAPRTHCERPADQLPGCCLHSGLLDRKEISRMTYFSKKALRELSKREQEMSSPQKTIKAGRVEEVRKLSQTVVDDKPQQKAAARKLAAVAGTR